MKNLYGIIRRLDYTLSDDDVRQIADEYIEKIKNELYDFSQYNSHIFTQEKKNITMIR